MREKKRLAAWTAAAALVVSTIVGVVTDGTSNTRYGAGISTSPGRNLAGLSSSPGTRLFAGFTTSPGRKLAGILTSPGRWR